jgi:threonine synthase
VAYHGADQDQFEKILGSRGVRRAGFANRPVAVANDLDDIIRAIALYSESASGATD